jgi:hypothetical protein
MPLPQALNLHVRDPRFWSDYTFETEPDVDWDEDEAPYPALKDCRITFPTSPEYALTLDLEDLLSYFSLGLRHPDAPEPVEVAWDDQAHWHPHVLRWPELDLIGRCVALNDPDLPHPGLPLLLLNRFAPICLDDDVDVIFPLLESAWRSLGVLDEREINRYVELYDRRQARFTWQHHEGIGWTIEQDEEGLESSGFELYTLRSAENDSFPFAAWNRMVEEARRACLRAIQPEWLRWNDGTVEGLARRVVETGDLGTTPILADALAEAGCENPVLLDALRSPGDRARAGWVVELLLGLEPGQFLRSLFGPTSRSMRVVYQFVIEIPTRTETSVMPPGSGARIAGLLARALSEAGLGVAEITGMGSTYTRDRRTLLREEVQISAQVRHDVDRGIQVIRETLRQSEAPEGTTIRLVTPERRSIPLDPGDDAGGP